MPSFFFKNLFKLFPQTLIYICNNELIILVHPE